MLPELLFHLGCKPTAGAGRLCVISLSRRNYRKGPTVHDTSSLLYILLYRTKPVWRVIIEAPSAVAKPSILIHFEGPLDGLTSLVSEFDFYTGRTPLSWVVLSCFIRLYPWLTVLGSLLGHEFDLTLGPTRSYFHVARHLNLPRVAALGLLEKEVERDGIDPGLYKLWMFQCGYPCGCDAKSFPAPRRNHFWLAIFRHDCEWFFLHKRNWSARCEVWSTCQVRSE